MPDQPRVSHRDGRKLAIDREHTLAELATRQHGVAALRQLFELGFSPREIDGRVKRGRLHRLYRGVFALGHRRLSRRGRWMAAVLACGEGAVLSHRSSAHLRGYLKRSGEPQLTVPRRVARRPRLRAYVFSALAPADHDLIDTIPCASVELTLLGLAATAPEALPGALAQAEKRNALDLDAVDELLARRARVPGGPALRDALRAHRVEWEWTNSELERRAHELFAAAGLPRPRVNAWIEVPGEGFEVDFTWPALRLAVEVDGWETHGDRRSFEDDRRRDALLAAAGWTVVRFTWWQVVEDPAFVLATVSGFATDVTSG